MLFIVFDWLIIMICPSGSDFSKIVLHFFMIAVQFFMFMGAADGGI
jgi:hypothetical protein